MPHLYIADDNLEFAEFLSIVSRRAGWTVEICENGQVLVEKLHQSKQPALALVDINMPEMDGIEAIEGMLDLPHPLRLRFMTGGADSSIIAAKMIASARDLTVGRNLFKPISKETLEKVLRDEAVALAEYGETRA